MNWILGIWLFWVILNVILFIVSPFIVKSAGPVTNGLFIKVPDDLKAKVTAEEFDALMAHEHGHMYHAHNLTNLLGVCFFFFRTKKRMVKQELQADDFAAKHGYAKELASALYKTSFNDFDFARAARLHKIAYLESGI